MIKTGNEKRAKRKTEIPTTPKQTNNTSVLPQNPPHSISTSQVEHDIIQIRMPGISSARGNWISWSRDLPDPIELSIPSKTSISRDGQGRYTAMILNNWPHVHPEPIAQDVCVSSGDADRKSLRSTGAHEADIVRLLIYQ